MAQNELEIKEIQKQLEKYRRGLRIELILLKNISTLH